MNTPSLRFLAVSLAFLAGGVTSQANGGGPPEILRWRRYAEPVFPPQLANTPVHDGFANLVFTFDDAGEVTDCIVIAASHPAFTGAVLEATRHWCVDTREMARPVRRETLRYDFRRTGAIVALSNRDATKALFSPYGDLAATAVSTCRENEIDRPLRVATTVNATYPRELLARGTRGHATVGFIVDALGRVRVPAVTDASDIAFGEAAVAALRQWTFAPARHRGLPVQVIVERTFVFGAGDRAPATAR